MIDQAPGNVPLPPGDGDTVLFQHIIKHRAID